MRCAEVKSSAATLPYASQSAQQPAVETAEKQATTPCGATPFSALKNSASGSADTARPSRLSGSKFFLPANGPVPLTPIPEEVAQGPGLLEKGNALTRLKLDLIRKVGGLKHEDTFINVQDPAAFSLNDPRRWAASVSFQSTLQTALAAIREDAFSDADNQALHALCNQIESAGDDYLKSFSSTQAKAPQWHAAISTCIAAYSCLHKAMALNPVRSGSMVASIMEDIERSRNAPMTDGALAEQAHGKWQNLAQLVTQAISVLLQEDTVAQPRGDGDAGDAGNNRSGLSRNTEALGKAWTALNDQAFANGGMPSRDLIAGHKKIQEHLAALSASIDRQRAAPAPATPEKFQLQSRLHMPFDEAA